MQAQTSEIHRQSEVARLMRVFEKPSKGLTICGISGPGGVGKTFLLRHVLDAVEPTASGYLHLTVNGENPQLLGDFFGLIDAQLLPRMLTPPANPARDYFPHVRDVALTHRAIIDAACKELAGAPPSVKDGAVALLKAGHLLNKAVHKTKDYLDVSALNLSDKTIRDSLDTVWDVVGALKALRASRFERLPGVARDLVGVTRRNRVRDDLYNVTADEMMVDLETAIRGWPMKAMLRTTQPRIQGVEQLLLVVDDFEATAPVLQEFLVSALVPKLAKARFPTVLVILGRDDVAAMHPSWEQHHRHYIGEQIRLRPLGREAAFEMLAQAGVPVERREACFKDTDGLPFLLNLLAEEATAEDAESALFLQKFDDRTTRWMTEVQKSWFEKVCHLDVVNMDTLPRLFPIRDVQQVQDWFQREASIRDPRASVFRVRPLIRDKMLRYQDLRSPSRHRDLAARAAMPTTISPAS